MRETMNVSNKEVSDAVTYKLEMLRAVNTSQNKNGFSLRETLFLPKQDRNLQMLFAAARHTVKELTL
jgi:hypothetical protein